MKHNSDVELLSKDRSAEPVGVAPTEPPVTSQPQSKGKPPVADMVAAIEAAGSESLLDGKRLSRVGDHTIRPVTLASIEMLRAIDSPLIAGKNITSPMQLLGDALEFIYLHSCPEEVAIDHCFMDKKARQKAVMKWAMNVSVEDVPSLVNETVATLVNATSTQVKGIPPKHLAEAAERQQAEDIMGSGKKD